MEFTITANNGDSVRIESQNWMTALGKALPFFAIELHTAGKLTCSAGSDGDVFVQAGDEDRTWMIRRIAPQLKVVAATPQGEPEDDFEEDLWDEPTSLDTPLPALSMPVTASFQKEAPATLGERLFDLTTEMAEVGAAEACRRALILLLEYVPATAGSVVRGTLNDSQLIFISAIGPASDRLHGRRVAFGEGLVGMSFDMLATLVVNDVSPETRHVDQFEEEAAHETVAAMCVPLIDEHGLAHGVIQLLNPGDQHFSPSEVETAEAVARTLANALSRRL